MARIGLKLFYLRTRERNRSQQVVAGELGIRQATLSNIEQGVSQPTSALLLELCKYFDVTPTFLLDEDRDVVPLPPERWGARNALVTTGMWVEVPADKVIKARDGRPLCPLLPGEPFYDAEAAELRAVGGTKGAGRADLQGLGDERRKQHRALVRALEDELKSHWQHRGR